MTKALTSRSRFGLLVLARGRGLAASLHIVTTPRGYSILAVVTRAGYFPATFLSKINFPY